MLERISVPLGGFLRGFYDVVPLNHLQVFESAPELELLVCGVVELDVDEWRRFSEYSGDFVPGRLGGVHKVVKWFWAVVEELTQEQRSRLLQFVTGTSRLPSGGFELLQGVDGDVRRFKLVPLPAPAGRKPDGMFPVAHTCFNRLDLPLYSTKAHLRNVIVSLLSADLSGFTQA